MLCAVGFVVLILVYLAVIFTITLIENRKARVPYNPKYVAVNELDRTLPPKW